MLKNFFITLIVLFVLVTALVLVTKPKPHKPVVFENQYFDVNLISDKSTSKDDYSSVTIPSVNIEIDTNVDLPKINIDLEKKTDASKTENIVKNTNSVSQKVVNNSPKKVLNAIENKQTNQTSVPIKKSEKDIIQPKLNVKEEVKQIVLPKEEPVEPQTKVILSEEQLEIIAWNKWRSDLQNQLMKDSKIAAPIGTTFYYTFTVDKNGNISNVKTWSNNPSYTQMAVNKIKPILLGYQKTHIVVFPAKSKRIITNVEGSFTMSYSNRYSTPADYNDYERVVY